MIDISQKKVNNEENSIIIELKSLSNSISTHFTENSQDINDLIKFFKLISLQFNDFGNNIKLPKKSSNLNINLFKNNLQFFYESQSLLMNKIRQMHELIVNEILVPLILYKDVYEKDKKNVLISLNDIIEELFKINNIIA